MKQCLDLFCGIGGFSAAFEESDNWEVTTIDIEEDYDPDICADVYNLKPNDIPNADVVLASPPCTLFSRAGNHDKWENERRPIHEKSRYYVGLVYHALGLIHSVNPDYWFLENPKGRLRYVIGEPTGAITYCQYGTEYMKPTELWGEHPRNFEYRICGPGSSCHTSNPDHNGESAVASLPEDYAERSKVPYGLSKYILKTIENDGQVHNEAIDW